MKNKLYYAPGASSFSTHLLLEEIGEPFELERVNLRAQEQFSDSYVQLNPKSQVPTLVRADGSVLTEIVAIASWLGASYPQRRLMPETPEEFARVYELMQLVATNMHPLGITRIFRSDKFAPHEADYEWVRDVGRNHVRTGLGFLGAKLHGGPFVLDRLSIADFVVFYMEYWVTFRLKWELPKSSAAHYEAMMARPSVQRTLKTEGYPHQG